MNSPILISDTSDTRSFLLYQATLLQPYSKRLIHGFSGKPLSLGGTELSRSEIQENRQYLCQKMGLNLQNLIVPGQVHRDIIKTSDDTGFSETDAVILLKPDIPVFIQTADCTPVLLYDTQQHIGAVIHAGWRGTAQSISAQCAQRMISEFGSRPENMMAIIGPAITQDHYEVSEEVSQALAQTLPAKTDRAMWQSFNENQRPQVDVKTVNRLQLKAIGITRIETIEACTGRDKNALWSHRRGEAGRQVLFLQLL